jgi:ankyrin repeat domain-containing protein 50
MKMQAFTDTERKCIAILTQNISNAAEYKCSLPSRVEGTCQWILSNKQYCDWNLRKESCLLWISGYPGSGKTILSTYILEDLSTGESSSSLRKDLCYFFCDEKIEKQRDALAILRSLIHQLLMRRRQLIRYLKAAYDIQGPQFDQNFNELWRIFIAIASDKRVGPINVIVDAIDECEEITRERFLQEVIKFIDKSRAPGSKSPCIKFLLTSRPLVGRQYTKDFHLQIDPSHNHVEQDLRLVIQTKVEGIVKRTRCKPEVGVYLENALYSKADRTFLWVTLVLHLLEKSFLASQKDFKRIIDELPQTLTATYERFLNGISIEYQPLAIRLLHFLVGSSRPLTLEEIRILTAMQLHHHTLAAVEEDAQPNIQETIEGVLGPLIRIWDSRIYLVHQSLKEYLQQLSTQRENQLPALYGVDPQKSSLLLAEACVSYLLFDDFKPDLFAVERSSIEDSPTSPAELPTDVESVEQLWDPFNLETLDLFKDSAVFDAEACARIGHQYTFFDYSARHWAEHISSASTICPPELQKSVLLLTDASQPQGLNWFKFYWQYAGMDLECPRDFVPIVTASYFGHSDSLEILLREGHPIESNVGTRSIYWASRMGHSDVVDRLLQEQVNLDMKVVDGQSAFIAAVYFNRLAVVKRLMEDDGFISEEQGYRVNCPAMGGRTPLSIAAGKGLIEVVNQLLHHDRIQPDIADFDQWTPLFWSVSGNHLDVLQLLVADGRLFLNHVDKAGQNVLSLAASAGKLELVKYLMSLRHLEAHVADHKGRTALSWAAGNGHLQTTVFLRRSQRIDTSVKDMDGRNALSWACSGAHYSVVKYLIKYDPQGVDEEDVDGWTPLAWALFSQAPKIVQVLLDSGLVDVNKKDRNGRSALSFAASYGYLDVVQILLNVEGIEIDSKDNDGRTPLSHATRYPDIASLLQSLSN